MREYICNSISQINYICLMQICESCVLRENVVRIIDSVSCFNIVFSRDTSNQV